MSSPYQLALCNRLEKYKSESRPSYLIVLPFVAFSPCPVSLLVLLVSPKAYTVAGYRHTLNKYTPRLQMSVRYEDIASGPPNNLTWTSTIYRTPTHSHYTVDHQLMRFQSTTTFMASEGEAVKTTLAR